MATDKTSIQKMHETMLRIRLYEEATAKGIEKGEIQTPCHLYIGQEAIAAGACTAIKNDDYVFSYYRGHGHYLAKGGDGKSLMAEIYCKETGCSGGRGGSMHLVAPEKRILGNTAIVSGQIAPAAGAALKSKLLGEKNVSIVFFGDAATEEGVFNETINFAALKKLPIIFICENNDFAAHMHLKDRQPITTMSLKASPFMPSKTIDGNDVETIYEEVLEAVQRARKGEGPTFIECLTYRWRGHVGPKYDLDKGIRTKEEFDKWVERCPIKAAEAKMLHEKIVTQKELAIQKEALQKEVEEAVTYAKNSPSPKPATLTKYNYQKEVQQ